MEWKVFRKKTKVKFFKILLPIVLVVSVTYIGYLISFLIGNSFSSTNVPLSFKYPIQMIPRVCELSTWEDYGAKGTVEKIYLGKKCPNTFGPTITSSNILISKTDVISNELNEIERGGLEEPLLRCSSTSVGDSSGYKCLWDSKENRYASTVIYYVFANNYKYEIVLVRPKLLPEQIAKYFFDKFIASFRFTK